MAEAYLAPRPSLRHHSSMSLKSKQRNAGKSKKKSKASNARAKVSTKAVKTRRVTITGARIPSVGGHLVLVRTGRFKRTVPIQKSMEADVLIAKVGKALMQPGIRRDQIFRGRDSNVFAYSVDPENPSRIIRRAADGTRTLGSASRGRFKAR
jgi:hypothetical protein